MTDSENTKKLKKSAKFTAIWLIIAALAVGGLTFAWFTFTASTNVEPMDGGAIGSGGAELYISDDANGIFSETADIVVNGEGNDLQPVSTVDLNVWSEAVSNDYNGISNAFQDASSKIDDISMYGDLYLKSEGGDNDVYFNGDELYFGNDDQLISSCRLGLTISTETDGDIVRIFKLDEYAGRGASEQDTMGYENVVIESTDGSGNATLVDDPSEQISSYSGAFDGDSTIPGDNYICTIKDEEIVKVSFRLYMEGCDPNCYNESQNRDINLKLAFVGVENKDY